MKHFSSLRSLFIVTPLLLVLVVSGVLSNIVPALGLPRASAATSGNYVFDTPKDATSLKALQDAVDKQNESAAIFSDTVIYVKGGVFGDTPLALNFNPDRSSCAQADKLSIGDCSIGTGDHFGGQSDDLYVYSGTYTCDGTGVGGNDPSKGTWTVGYNVSVNLGKTGASNALFDSSGKLNDNVRLHWVGFGTVDTPGITYAPPGGAPTTKNVSDLPAKCFPPNVPDSIKNSAHNDTELSNSGIVNLDIATLPQASKAVQDAWAAAGVTAGTGSSGGSSSDLELDCNAGFNPLNWLICGAIKGMVAVLRGVDGIINSLLSIGTPDETTSGDPTNIFDTKNASGSGKAYYTAWSNFRNIALGMLLIAGLIMIMSQAIGMEILDAYTIRKVLPRLLIVAVAITISWPGLRFLVEFFNDLGYGVRYLIQHPFATQLNDTIKLSGGQGTAVLFATPLAFAALGVFGLFTFVGTALLAAFIAFLVLIIRQIVVVVLIVVAPIALVMYILPNTQKYWQLWQNSLFGALLMFPIISAVIAAGRVFAAVANNGGGVNETLDSYIAFGAYFAPYFLIPATFKFAGGALRSIGGFVNDRGRGGFDRLRKARQESSAKHIKAARAGQRWRHNFGEFGKADKHGNRKSVGKILSRGAELGLDVDEQVPFFLGAKNVPGFKGYKAKVENYLGGEGAIQTQKVAQEMESKAGLNKQGYRAILGSYGALSQDTRRGLANAGFINGYQEDADGNMVAGTQMPARTREHYKQIADIMSRSTSQDDRIGALGVNNVYGMLPTLNSDPETMRANVQGAALIGLAARGYGEEDDIELAGNRIASEKGMDYAQRIVAIAEKTGQQYHPEAKFGHSQTVINTPEGLRFQASRHNRTRALSTLASVKSSDFAQMKGDALKARHPYIVDMARETRYDPETRQNVLTDRAEGMRKIIVAQASTHGNAEPEAKAEWSRIVDNVGPDLRTTVNMYDRVFDERTQNQQGPPPPPPDDNK